MHEIAFADDTDKLAGIVYNRNGADPSVDKRFRNLLNRRMGLNRNDRRYHHIPSFHGLPLGVKDCLQAKFGILVEIQAMPRLPHNA